MQSKKIGKRKKTAVASGAIQVLMMMSSHHKDPSHPLETISIKSLLSPANPEVTKSLRL